MNDIEHKLGFDDVSDDDSFWPPTMTVKDRDLDDIKKSPDNIDSLSMKIKSETVDHVRTNFGSVKFENLDDTAGINFDDKQSITTLDRKPLITSLDRKPPIAVFDGKQPITVFDGKQPITFLDKKQPIIALTKVTDSELTSATGKVVTADNRVNFPKHETLPQSFENNTNGLLSESDLDSKSCIPSELPVLVPTLPASIAMDHNYSRPFFPLQNDAVTFVKSSVDSADTSVDAKMEVDVFTKPSKISKSRKYKNDKLGRLSDLTNHVPGSRELVSLLPPVSPPKHKFPQKTRDQEIFAFWDFLCKGIDSEDIAYMQQTYESLLQVDIPQTYWLNDTHWYDHPPTFSADVVIPPPRKKRKFNCATEVFESRHKTGENQISFSFIHQDFIKTLHLETRIINTYHYCNSSNVCGAFDMNLN